MQPFSICRSSPELVLLLGKDRCDNSGCTLAVRPDGIDDLVEFVQDDPDTSPGEFGFLLRTISSTKDRIHVP